LHRKGKRKEHFSSTQETDPTCEGEISMGDQMKIGTVSFRLAYLATSFLTFASASAADHQGLNDALESQVPIDENWNRSNPHYSAWNSFHGSTKQTRYKALLSFELGKEFLATADADTVAKVVHAVVTPESEAVVASTKERGSRPNPAQVEAALGKPDKVVHLGRKMNYVYKDMKIVFCGRQGFRCSVIRRKLRFEARHGDCSICLPKFCTNQS